MARSALSLLAAISALVLLARPVAAADPILIAELYRAQTIVTGTGETNRLIGFATCLEDALIKASGRLRLAGDPRLAPFKADAARMVRDFSYRDEKGGRPKNDEQGTRDRSFFLTVDFDAAAIDGVLAKLGVTPWLARRPVLAVFVELQLPAKRYVVAGDARDTELQRAALLAAAAKRGMQIVLPDAADLSVLGANEQALASIAPATLAETATARGGEVVLIARLVWDDEALRWNSHWRLAGPIGAQAIAQQTSSQQWQLSAVTFDETFRQGIGTAAQIISEAR